MEIPIISRRKFFSFFGAGVVMAVAPKLVLPGEDSWYATLPEEYVTPGYGNGLAEVMMFMRYLDEQMRRVVLTQVWRNDARP